MLNKLLCHTTISRKKVQYAWHFKARGGIVEKELRGRKTLEKATKHVLLMRRPLSLAQGLAVEVLVLFPQEGPQGQHWRLYADSVLGAST